MMFCKLPLREKIAEISALVLPSLIWLASALSPKTKARASNRMDLPAPVSPVRTVKPFSRSMSRVSTMTKSRMFKLRSIFKTKKDVHSNEAFVLVPYIHYDQLDEVG